MNILIITDVYPPELRSSAELMRELAVAFRKKGHEVAVATSSSKNEVQEEDGVRVIRVKTLPHHNVSFVVKGLSWILMPRLFWSAVKKHCLKIDVAIVHSPPLTLAWVAEQAKKKYKAKYILNVQDIFPQNAIDLGVLKNKAIIKFFERMERHAYASCDAIVTPSHKHEEYLTKKRGVPKEKISVIPHWVNIEQFEKAENTGKFRKQFGLENKFIIFFGGVIGPSQGLDILLHLGEKLQKTHPDIVFLVCGDGSEKKRLVEEAKEKNITNVRFENWISKEEYPSLLKEMDIGLISLTSKNTTPAVPAKLMSYLAAGIPALGFLHEKSEAHNIIKDARCGASAIYEDEDACLKTLLYLYDNKARLKEWGENGLRYAQKNLTPEVSVEKWESIVKSDVPNIEAKTEE
ncbi:MAG: glycosyltransferase family 4 protein [Nanoarchaeota archaeon]|nr:glycosyltransferase family 4 protein [Nanoarchaeota archaeon]